MLWWMVDRPNLFVKIPATRAGLPAITACLAEGISVNVTLIFSVEPLRGGAWTPTSTGLEQAQAAGRDLSADRLGRLVLRQPGRHRGRRRGWTRSAPPRPLALRGKAAIANARLAYQRYEQVFGSERWKGSRPRAPGRSARCGRPPGSRTPLRRHPLRRRARRARHGQHHAGGHPAAVADHGVVRAETIRSAYGEAQQVMDTLRAVGVDMGDVFHALEADGVSRFQASWRELQNDVADALAENRG